ncbi:hypothetical protein DEO72_LG3g2090 [Vigna unguiculata]|uniref:Uncharacterized protein n=1 Tax=Vigna unguiculata TaxID=3917 RepID=A0A4D6LGC4_VIGUN|nr:hypothetical protein DEO72_LG3g2090 [Vigna unguiculata]
MFRSSSFLLNIIFPRFVVLVVVTSRSLQTLFQGRTDNLAQVSLSHLGEMSGARPSLFARGLRRPAQFERASVSPRRGGSRLSEKAQRPLFQDFEPSPERETLSLERDSSA